MAGGDLPVWAGAYVVAVEFAGALAAVLAVYAWRNRQDPGAKPLSVLMTAVAGWCLLVVLRIVTEPIWLSHLLERPKFVTIGLTVSGWVAFALEFTDNEEYLNRYTIALLAGHPIALLAATAFVPELFWEPIQAVPVHESLLGYTAPPGPLFMIHAVYSYVILTSGFVLLVQHAIRSRSVYWQQGISVIAGAFVVYTGNLVFVLGLVPVDTTPISYGIAGLAFSWAIFSYRLMDLTPVARERIVDSISDAVFVLDREDRVTDLNPPAEQLLSIDEDAAIGSPANAVFGEFPGLYEQYADTVQTSDEIELASGGETRVFEFEITPIYDTHDRVFSRLFIFHDITEQRRRQADLEQQNEQLDRFASVVSHDLRNPINVARGYVDVAMETDDVDHLAEAQISFDRMEAIIDDVLTMAREGTRIDDPEPVDLEEVAREAWSHVETAGATFESAGSMTFEADRQRLQRVLENLMRNAIDHGSGDLTVTVGTHTVDDEDVFADAAAAGFYVADDGPGIPEDEREDVLESGYTTADDGTGLGLSIVQSIAESHGWTVSVTESAAGGARIEVRDVVTLASVDTV
jgi:PAS domain S-box-containing protein